MSRRVNSDFGKLASFLHLYSLESVAINEQQMKEAKKMHKKLYPLIIICAEFNIHEPHPQASRFLDETISDLTLSMFAWIQGMYKPSKLIMRCAIENFIKAMLGIHNPLIFDLKSVYEIFDLASLDYFFGGKFKKQCLDRMHEDYVLLCRTVHSAPSEITPLSALQTLPNYNYELSKGVHAPYSRIAENMMKILYVNFPHIVDLMHPENKKDFFDCLMHTTKTQINKELFEH